MCAVNKRKLNNNAQIKKKIEAINIETTKGPRGPYQKVPWWSDRARNNNSIIIVQNNN